MSTPDVPPTPTQTNGPDRRGITFQRTKLSVAGVEFWSVWNKQGRSWDAASAALAPAMRVVDAWDQRTLTEAVDLTTHMARVSATGLPLGMVEDKAVAGAAQRLTDAALEDKGEEKITAAVRELRAAFYGKAVER
ncbi:hypothetical protein [Streptomyces sp. NPDC003996]